MKTLFVPIFLLISIFTFGQSNVVNINEETITINEIKTNVASTLLKGDFEKIKKEWKSFIKEKINQKMSGKDDILIAKELVINSISEKRGDFIAYFVNKGEDISLNIAFKLGYDISLNSNQYPDEFSKLKNLLESFVYKYYNENLKDQIKDKSKEIKKMTNEKEKNESQIKKSNKLIEKSDEKIIDNNKSIYKLSKTTNKEEVDAAKQAENKEKTNKLTAENIELQQTIEKNKELLKESTEKLKTIIPQIEKLNTEFQSLNAIQKEINTKLEIINKK